MSDVTLTMQEQLVLHLIHSNPGASEMTLALQLIPTHITTVMMDARIDPDNPDTHVPAPEGFQQLLGGYYAGALEQLRESCAVLHHR